MREKRIRSKYIRRGRLLLVVVLIQVVGSEHVEAQYIDPGSGSYILQLLMAGFLAAAFYSRKIRDYIKYLYSKVFSKK